MKKTMFILTATMFVLGLATMSYAQTPISYAATAAVDSELRLTASVIRVDTTSTGETWWTIPSTNMSFGTLTHFQVDGTTEAGLLFSNRHYVAFLGGFTSGRKYRIYSTCTGLVGPTMTIVDGFGVTYFDGDPKKSAAEGGLSINSSPMVGSLGLPGTAVFTNKLMYDSGPTGASRVIAAYFAIPCYKALGVVPFPGFIKIPVDTPQGTYTGNVIFSIALY